jgi:hypothetical protein
MNHLDPELQAALDTLHAAGNRAWIDPATPYELKRAFLMALWSCPDCRKVLERGGCLPPDFPDPRLS